jgi:hypothetical protein
MEVVPCIVCGNKLKPMDSGSPNHADDANEFSTHGQYGSTVFDPVNGDRLAVNICDKCLAAGQELGRVLFGRHGSTGLDLWKRE